MRYVTRTRQVCTGISLLIKCISEKYLDHTPIEVVDGDKTVLGLSSTYLPASTYFVNLPAHNRELDRFRVNREHSDILEIEGIRNLVREILVNASIGIHNNISDVKPAILGSHLRLKILSPVSIEVTDRTGAKTDITNEEIPNSYYLEFGEGKYVGLDTADTYTIKLQGLDTGTFIFGIDEVSGDQITDTLLYENIPVTPSTIVTMTIQTIETASALAIDVNGDGIVDVSISPNETIDEVDSLNVLEQIVKNLTLKSGIKKSMLAKISVAKKYVATGQITKALDVLQSLQDEIKALAGKSISVIDAQKLMQIIETIKQSL